MSPNSIDSLVTDPPAGISFMGKAWDDDKGGRDQWIAWMTEVMKECMRVLKPGAHGVVWAIPRTSHWTATALENAGFEVRDVVTHLFGSGFPKSHNIEKATSDERFKGFGTALKPASEHWILVRKPCSENTVAANVLKHGTGGINIDASRICADVLPKPCTNNNIKSNNFAGDNSDRPRDTIYNPNSAGRFPANLILSHSDHCTEGQCDIECPIKMLDEQSGPCKTGGRNIKTDCGDAFFKVKVNVTLSNDIGKGASRFFYCAKASRAEKNAGCDMGEKRAVGVRPHSGDMSGKFPDHDQRERVGNFHPTVKASKLMAYLIKLVTPPNGVVLDPFAGSGSTGVAALKEGFDFLGIEQTEEYAAIAIKRILSVSKVE